MSILKKATENVKALAAQNAISNLQALRSSLSRQDSTDDSDELSYTYGNNNKLVGPVEDLPPTQKPLEGTLVHSKSDHKRKAYKAMRRTADPGDFKPDADSISLSIGLVDAVRDQTRNAFSPVGGHSLPYSRSVGLLESNRYKGKVFNFRIKNLATEFSLPKEGSITQISDDITALRFPTDRLTDNQPSEIFPAYISNLNESFGASWSPIKPFGRSEPLYFYDSTSRDITLGFMMFATNNGPSDIEEIKEAVKGLIRKKTSKLDFLFGSDESELGYKIPSLDFSSIQGLILPGQDSAIMLNAISKKDLWRKIQFLISCVYPRYANSGRLARVPFVKIDFADLWRDQLMIIESMSFSYAPLLWDISPKDTSVFDIRGRLMSLLRSDLDIKPMFIDVTISGKLLHEQSPGSFENGDFGYYDSDGFRTMHGNMLKE